MKYLLQLEEVGRFILAFTLTLYLGFPWWMFLAWLLVPDVSMLGYLVNNKAGAWTYNFFHHQALAIAIGLSGLFLANLELQFAGLVLFGHSAMDRVFGYGLKFSDDFKHTHLGWIGKG